MNPCCVFRSFAALLLMLCLGLPVLTAWGTEGDQATRLTFNQPVELPGVTLPAGTYVFTVLPDIPDRNIVQVWNADRTRLLATILAIPDYRLHVTDKPVLQLSENATGYPQEVKAWFYPGDEYGHEFVFPKSQATRLARRTHQPVLYVPDTMAGDMKKGAKSAKDSSVAALRNAPVRAVTPSGNDVDAGQVATLKAPSQTSKPH